MTEKTFDEEVGDRTYLEVLKSLILTRIDSCRAPWVGIERIDGTIEDLKFINSADLYRVFGIVK